MGGRLRKRKIKHAKRAWRLAPSGIASEWTRRGFWPRPWAAHRWPAASWPTRSCCRSSSAFAPELLGDFQPGAGALDGQLALHFGQARHDVEEKPPGRRAGIDGIGQAPELDAMLVQVADQINQLLD